MAERIGNRTLIILAIVLAVVVLFLIAGHRGGSYMMHGGQDYRGHDAAGNSSRMPAPSPSRQAIHLN